MTLNCTALSAFSLRTRTSSRPPSGTTCWSLAETVGDDELTAALDAVGLGDWLASLPDGLSTVLTGGAQAVSAGQRRRLLLARAVISPARIVLLDEPTEHLDATDAERVLADLLAPASRLMGQDRTVLVATHHCPTTFTVPNCASDSREPGAG